MKKLKLVQVLMLLTEKASNINLLNGEIRGGILCHTIEKTTNTPNFKNQHLYLTSTDEIKEKDWCYGLFPQVKSETTYWNIIIAGKFHLNNDNFKKIVASTDSSLGLPLIPESFIKAYIEAYNSGKPITEVNIELTDMASGIYQGLNEDAPYIKVREDNTVICHPVKLYTRDEVIEFAKKYSKAEYNICEDFAGYEIQQEIDKWINENL